MFFFCRILLYLISNDNFIDFIDFDEQTADDWDVDMSAYYEEGAGDKDARDFLTMREEKQRREGIVGTDRFNAGTVTFMFR